MKVLALIPLIALTGCMAGNPARPVLTCSGECTYYGPQQPDPRVEMARVLTGGLSSVAGIVVGGDVLKALGTGSGATSTTERTTNNSVTDRLAVTDRDHSIVTNTSVSSSAVSNTSTSDKTSITSNTGVQP